MVKAIRENEPRAISLGYKSNNINGSSSSSPPCWPASPARTKAMVMGIETLSDVGAAASGLVVLMVLLGGIGTIFGPLIGALIVVAMQYYLSPFGAWVMVIQGVIFMACVLVFRRGVIGELAYRLKTRAVEEGSSRFFEKKRRKKLLSLRAGSYARPRPKLKKFFCFFLFTKRSSSSSLSNFLNVILGIAGEDDVRQSGTSCD